MLEIKTPTKGLVAHGISFCAGCGLELSGRTIIDVLGKNTVIVIPPGCAALFSGLGNETSVQIPGFQGNLENTAAYAAGIKAGFEMQGKSEINVLGMAGDGGTVDIGLQSLSGALERGDKIIYVCHDNEAYMNTGIQGSGSTPRFCWSTTTPTGKTNCRKDMLRIVTAHNIPYVASASIGYIDDLRKKVEKAKVCGGPAYLHIHVPCPTGWGVKPEHSVEVARLAVQTRCWNLYEIVNGELKITYPVPKPKEVALYLKMQKRFSGISEEEIQALQADVNKEYERLLAEAETVN